MMDSHADQSEPAIQATTRVGLTAIARELCSPRSLTSARLIALKRRGQRPAATTKPDSS